MPTSSTSQVIPLTFAELHEAWIKAGGLPADARIAAAIALAESGGVATAVTTHSDGSWSAGPWQISTEYHGKYGLPNGKVALLNYLSVVDHNAIAAVKIREHEGFDAWDSYVDETYTKFLPHRKSTSAAAAGGAEEMQKLDKGGKQKTIGQFTASQTEMAEQVNAADEMVAGDNAVEIGATGGELVAAAAVGGAAAGAIPELLDAAVDGRAPDGKKVAAGAAVGGAIGLACEVGGPVVAPALIVGSQIPRVVNDAQEGGAERAVARVGVAAAQVGTAVAGFGIGGEVAAAALAATGPVGVAVGTAAIGGALFWAAGKTVFDDLHAKVDNINAEESTVQSVEEMKTIEPRTGGVPEIQQGLEQADSAKVPPTHGGAHMEPPEEAAMG
jgi:nitrogen fixation-related uncharacterized protein